MIGQQSAEVADELPSAVLIGWERTPDADPGFGLLQLVDIALRALSPGVNDPTTAKHALGHVTSLLLQIADLGAGTIRITSDDQGDIRVQQHLPGLDELVRECCLPLARAGGHDPDVLLALLRLLHVVGQASPAHLRPGIDAVTGFVERTAARDLADPQDQQTLRTAIAAMRAS